MHSMGEEQVRRGSLLQRLWVEKVPLHPSLRERSPSTDRGGP